MSPLTISVTGDSTLFRRAERAVVFISVHSEGSSQQEVSKNVTTTSNQLRTTLKDMALKTPEGKPTEDAPITHWSMTSLSTGSHFPRDDDGKKLPRAYTAKTSFEVKFVDFAELGTFATMLSTMEHVSIAQIAWKLSEATKASLGTQSRQDAVRNAMERAHDLAEALGKKDFVATEVSDNGDYSNDSVGRFSHGMYVGPRTGRGSGEELNFEPEDCKLTCRVRIQCRAE